MDFNVESLTTNTTKPRFRASKERKESTSSQASAVVKDLISDKQFQTLIECHIHKRLKELQTEVEKKEARILELEVQDEKRSRQMSRLEASIIEKDATINNMLLQAKKRESEVINIVKSLKAPMSSGIDELKKVMKILEVGCHSLDDIATILKQDDVKGDAARPSNMMIGGDVYPQSPSGIYTSGANTANKLVLEAEFLKQECSVCFVDLPRNELMSLINCQCMMCRECIIEHFTIIARDQSIMKGKCPSCDQPNLDDTAVAADYFAFLDILLREMLSSADFQLFTRKLRDWNLMQDENFCWCAHCNSGFLNGAPERRKMRCPECNKLTCVKCKKQWMDQHEGISCEAFQEWKENNDPDLQAQGLAAHLNENGIECPRCKMRYELAKGGCMHFKCPQCTFEFCCGCNQPMKKGEDCNRFASCRNKGLHAHHPRDCLFYLREEDITFLQKLLKDAGVHYNKDPPQGAEENEEGVCGVKEQQDGPNGLVDNKCGRTVTPKNAGLCRVHYSEYLVGLINNNQIDPAKSFPRNQLEIILKREEVPVPLWGLGERDLDFRKRLLIIVQNKLPLKKSTRNRLR